jgi:hypothetical protein
MTTTKLACNLGPGDVFQHHAFSSVWLEFLARRVNRRRGLLVITVCTFGCDRNSTVEIVMEPDETVEVAP